MGRTGAVLLTAILLSSVLQLGGCGTDTNKEKNSAFKPTLSDYGIFQGKLTELVPVDEATIIEIASPLFTDYADKQRIVLLPKGEKMKGDGSGLPDFPDGTVIAKTFFYPRSSSGNPVSQFIVETRLLIKSGPQWNAAT